MDDTTQLIPNGTGEAWYGAGFTLFGNRQDAG